MSAFTKARKIISIFAYLLFLSAGIVFLFLPSNVVAREGGLFNAILWHTFLITGSVTALIGAVTGRKFYEAVGGPLLIAAMCAYGLILVWPTFSGAYDGPRLGLGLLIFGAMLGLVERMVELIGWIRIAIDLDKREGPGG